MGDAKNCMKDGEWWDGLDGDDVGWESNLLALDLVLQHYRRTEAHMRYRPDRNRQIRMWRYDNKRGEWAVHNRHTLTSIHSILARCSHIRPLSAAHLTTEQKKTKQKGKHITSQLNTHTSTQAYSNATFAFHTQTQLSFPTATVTIRLTTNKHHQTPEPTPVYHPPRLPPTQGRPCPPPPHVRPTS